MRHSRTFALMIASMSIVAACGSDTTSNGTEAVDSVVDTPAAAPTDAPQPSESTSATATPATTTPATTATASSSSTSWSVELAQSDQPAIWPAPEVVIATPEEAAASFVTEVLGVDPVLGDFLAGDARSGEISVFSPGEVEGADLLERGVLMLRMIGPDDGWFVIAAASPGITIETPQALDRVSAGPTVVSGEGRGFESTIVATAFRSGDVDDVLDQVIGRGGPFAAVEPFDVTLDLSGGSPDDVIAVIVRGDTGLDGDPGEFAAVPIVIDGTLPATT
jgi:hypothetical protein